MLAHEKMRPFLQSADYRPDIDGLRAVAVILVMLFHAQVPPFTGGFVGVDVFFVISGFLITGIVVREKEATARFSFVHFYVRRARRILPALFFTIALSFPFAFVLFSPKAMEGFSGSAVSAVLSLSNIYFWLESGYFDADALTKPLLHTWSLGVEEQFYLCWPLFLLLLTKLRGKDTIIKGITVAGVTSLLLNICFLSGNVDWLGAASSAVFFLTPFRVFELALGAALVWIADCRPLTGCAVEAIFVLGLAMIGFAALIYTDATPFPSTAALVPCIGTCLIILAGRAHLSKLLLCNWVAVYIGLISYSIYLLHWPAIVFSKAYIGTQLTAGETAGLMASVLVAAALMNRLVEVPFLRGGKKPRLVFAICFAAAVIVGTPSMLAWTSGGWVWRLPPGRVSLSNAEWRDREREEYCRSWEPSMPRDLMTCQNFRGAKKDLFVWGDSHALHLVAGLSEVFKDRNVYILHMDACTPQSGFVGYVFQFADKALEKRCIDRNQRALEFFANRRPTEIILTGAKRDTAHEVAPPTNKLLESLRSMGHRAVYLGDFMRPGADLNACRSIPAWLISDDELYERCAPDEAIVQKELRYNRDLSQLVSSGFVDPTPFQCPNGECSFFDGERPLFRDSHHLTIEGSKLLIGDMKTAIIPDPLLSAR